MSAENRALATPACPRQTSRAQKPQVKRDCFDFFQWCRGPEWGRESEERSEEGGGRAEVRKGREGFTGGNTKNAVELSGSVEERNKKHTHAHTELRIVGNELVVWRNGRQAGREGGSPGRANCRTPYNRGGHFVASRRAAASRSCIITPFLCSLG